MHHYPIYHYSGPGNLLSFRLARKIPETIDSPRIFIFNRLNSSNSLYVISVKIIPSLTLYGMYPIAANRGFKYNILNLIYKYQTIKNNSKLTKIKEYEIEVSLNALIIGII